MLKMPDLIKLFKYNDKQFVTHNHEALFTVKDSEDKRGKNRRGSHKKSFFKK